MQPIPNPLHKRPINRFRVFWAFQSCIISLRVVDYLVALLDGPHVGHLAAVEDVVYVLQEDLVEDLVISEEESHGKVLVGGLAHHRF